MGEPVIHGRGLTKIFKNFWGRNKVAALTDVDIDVSEGCIFGLLGPNGAGKSTLIKLIIGHLYPTRGQLAVLGASPRDVKAKARLGFLPEQSYLYKDLTAQETLRYFGEILNLSRAQIDSRSGQLLEMVGLESVRKRRIGEFSHGMNRRMGLAQALLNDPDFLILDEPTAGMDPVGCREVKDLIITLGKRGKTVLLSSHLLADVEDVCDEILLLLGGRVQSTGSVAELLKVRERTVMEFPTVSDATLRQAKAALAGEIDDEAITTRSPSEDLETYFLKMVAAGDAEARESTGARVGKGVAEYLRDSDYRVKSIEDEIRFETEPEIDTSTLAALESPAGASATDTSGQTVSAVDHETLEALSGSGRGDGDERGAKDKEIDQELLDELTR